MAMTEKEKIALGQIGAMLSNFYSPPEMVQWIFLPQPLLGGESAASLIEDGQYEEVIGILRALEDCVYI